MENLILSLSENPIIKILIIVVLLDIFLGSIRAIKEHSWNSTVGINGILRKVGMLGSILFLSLADMCINLNLLSMLPEEFLEVISIEKIGTSELFGIMFICYEFTSILKNMILCDMPVPAVLKNKIEKLLKNMTTELDKEGK